VKAIDLVLLPQLRQRWRAERMLDASHERLRLNPTAFGRNGLELLDRHRRQVKGRAGRILPGSLQSEVNVHISSLSTVARLEPRRTQLASRRRTLTSELENFLPPGTVASSSSKAVRQAWFSSVSTEPSTAKPGILVLKIFGGGLPVEGDAERRK
jgi:hypothetical protein